MSHAGTDLWVARQIESQVKLTGATTFLDEAHIAIADDFPEAIRNHMEEADELLVLLTPWSIHRPWVLVEIGQAFQRRIPIVGVLYGLTETQLRQDVSFPVFLLSRRLLQLNDFDRYLNELRERNRKDAGARG